MSVKRARIGRSSANLCETDVLEKSPPPPPPSFDRAMLSRVLLNQPAITDMAGQSRSPILTVCCPLEVLGEDHVHDKQGVFLENCSYCKEKIHPKDNIYMYSGSAFCSVLCRGTQIAIDRRAAEEEEQKKKIMDRGTENIPKC